MTNEQAWEYAAKWGSFITNGDPGSCMYGFDENFIVQNEAHRQDCLDWIDQKCIPLVTADPSNFDKNELAKLQELRAKIARKPSDANVDVEEFFEGMINAALFFSTEDDDGSSFSDNGATLADLGEKTRVALHEDAEAFVADNGPLIVKENFIGRSCGSVMSQAGHDFWLTRCGHGAGFWDGDWVEDVGNALAKASDAFGEVDLGRGDDGLIHT